MKISSTGSKLWQQLYGGSSDEQFAGARQTSDGGYIIGAQTRSYGAGSADLWLIKTDAAGVKSWDRTFGGTANDFIHPYGCPVRQCADGGYVFVGTTNSSGPSSPDVYLVRTDATGAPLWTRTFGATRTEQGNSVCLAADGGFLVSGLTYSSELGALGSGSVYTLKVDAAGNEQWQRVFGGSGADSGSGVLQTADGSFLVAGTTSSYGAGSSDIYLIRIAPIPSDGLTFFGRVTGDIVEAVQIIAVSGNGSVVASSVTDATGGYVLEHVPYAWSGAVVPSKPGYAFLPTSRVYAKPLIGAGGQDFVSHVSVGGEDWGTAGPTLQSGLRSGQTAVSLNGSIFIMGGERPSSTYLNDVWRSPDGLTWTCIASAAPWHVRAYHGSAVHNGQIWVLGGSYRDGSFFYLNDVWSSPNGQDWTQKSASASWSGRSQFGALSHNGKLWVLGGYRYDGANRYLNDVWSSPDGISWTQTVTTAPWAGRSAMSAVVHDGKLWVLGGYYNDGSAHYLNDVWSSADGVNWSQMSAAAPWSARRGAAAVVSEGRIWLLGGTNGSSYYNDVWSSANGVDWTCHSSSSSWQTRAFASAVSFDDRIWLFNGVGFSSPSIVYRSDAWYSWSPSAAIRIAAIEDQSIEELAPYTGPLPVLERGETPVVWSLIEGPAGTTLNEQGVVSWPTPVCAGSPHRVTIRVAKNSVWDDETWMLNVSANPMAESITKPGTPSGPTSGASLTPYSYVAGASVSSHGHELEYCYDWGDATNSFWLSATSAEKAWSTEGVYHVKVRARCKIHTFVTSEWSNECVVSITNATGAALVWVDFAAPPGGTGTIEQPCNSIAVALNRVTAGGTIRVQGASSVCWSTETPRIAQTVRIEAVGGNIRIGCVQGSP